MSFASSGKPALPGKASGLEFEIVPRMEGNAVALQVLRNGKPADGVNVQVLFGGQEEAKLAGKTGEQGKIVYSREAGAKGPVLTGRSRRRRVRPATRRT